MAAYTGLFSYMAAAFLFPYVQGSFHIYKSLARWAYHANNSSWYTMPKHSSPSMVHFYIYKSLVEFSIYIGHTPYSSTPTLPRPL